MTPQDVLDRLAEAARVIAASERREGPAALRAFFPEGVAPGDYPKGISTNFRPSSAEVSRAEEAMSWLSLITDPDRRRKLAHYALCKGTRGKWAAMCRKMGWVRTTAWSQVNSAAAELANILNPVRQSSDGTTSSAFRQFEALRDPDLDTVEKCATSWIAEGAELDPAMFGTDPDPEAWVKKQRERLRRKKLGAEIEEEYEKAPSRAR